MFQGKSLFQAEMPKETVTQCVSYCGVSELFNTTNCAGIMKECLFKTNAAPHFASHEVATAYSLGRQRRQPKVAGVPYRFRFFSVKPSPKDFNNKAPGRAAHPGFGVGLSMNAEGVRQTALL